MYGGYHVISNIDLCLGPNSNLQRCLEVGRVVYVSTVLDEG